MTVLHNLRAVGGSKLVHTTVRKEWEARFVSEYLAEKFPDVITMHRVPLGDIPQALKDEHGDIKAAKWFRPSRPIADAIAIADQVLVLIEGKIFDPNRALGQLLFYNRLIGYTPELSQYKDLPRILQLVTARTPPWASHAEAFPDIQIVEYQPTWINEYYAQLQGYWTKEARQGRQARKDVLKSLGYG